MRLKGHQIIGELRQMSTHRRYLNQYWKVTRSLVSYDFVLSPVEMRYNWKVTRSLVSYDKFSIFFSKIMKLKGHQIIGELRRWSNYYFVRTIILKGHQIIGELRQTITL